jgi:hypothetical protein
MMTTFDRWVVSFCMILFVVSSGVFIGTGSVLGFFGSIGAFWIAVPIYKVYDAVLDIQENSGHASRS